MDIAKLGSSRARHTRFAIYALFAMAGSAGSASAAITHTTIAQTGGSVAGGGTYSAFSSTPVVNASGEVVFLANSTGGPADLIGKGNGTTSSVVAGSGGATPLGGTYTVGGFSEPTISAAGDVYFSGNASGGSAPGALFKQSGGSTTPLLTRGSASPLGGTYSSFFSPRANNAGQLAFGAVIAGGSGASGAFRTNGTTTTTIAAQGAAAPAGGTYGVYTGIPNINNAGKTSFFVSVTSGNGIYVGDGASTQAVAITATASPLGGQWSGFTTPTINNAGVIAFNATITGGSVATANFFFNGTTFTTIAALGDAVPGLSGVTISSLSSPKINNNGVAVFRAVLTGTGVTTTNDTVYLIGTKPSDLSILVREGDAITIGGVSQTLTGNLSANFWDISDNGFVWRPAYASGSAIVYSSDGRFSVPTPGALVTLGAGMIVAVRRRR